MKSSFYIDRTFNAIQIFPPCSLLPLPLDILFSSASLRLWAFSPIYLLDLALHIIFVHLQMLFLFGKRAPPSKEHTPIVFTSLPLKFMPQIKSTPVYLKDLSFRYLKIDDGGVSSEEGLSAGDGDFQDEQLHNEDRELKDKLLLVEYSLQMALSYGKYSSFKLLFHGINLWSKRCSDLFDESDKIALAKSTGLDQKQINNWFINQRKRHWKPSENMPFAMVDGLTGRFLTDE
ncbi:hypothetical protein ACSQ67_005976 [Phaseolus vulgaris]